MNLQAQSEEAKAALQAGVTRSKAVTGILKAARKGNELADVGILGRLGDLATISDQYDVAISTACGYLDHIVVQTTAGAQRCLEFLRKHGLGRANFIPLDKMKKGAHDRVVETPEGAPRLFDLITPSNYAITPALYLGVGNTLVAPDLETATRWAYDFGKRWRVVTLDGSLIEISGTMQGGGKSVRRGGMRFTNSNGSANSDIVMDGSEDECKRLEHLAEKALEDLKQCRAQRRDLAIEVRDLKKKVKTLSVEIPKLSMEIASCDTTREELTKSLPQLRAQCVLSDEDASKLKTLKSNVEKCKSDMASCAMLASKLEADVARLQKAILDAGGPRQKKQRKVCDDVVSKLNATTTKLNSAKVMITSSRKAAEKAKVAKENAEKEFELAKITLEEKKEEFKKLEDEAFAVMQAYERVQAFEAEKKKGLESVLKETEGLRKIQSDIKCIEVDLIAKIESCTKGAQDIQKKIKHWEHELTLLREAQSQDDEFDMSDDEDDVSEPKENGNDENHSDDVVMDDVSSDGKNVENVTKSPTGESSLPVFNECALEQYDISEVTDEIASLEKERDSIAKNANMAAIAEYRKKESDYLAR